MTYYERIDRFRARLLTRALRITKGDTAKAAAMLGVPRPYVYVSLKRYGIELKKFRPGAVEPKTQPKKTYFGVPIDP